MRFRLTKDITAEALALDATDGDEGYPRDHVIGPVGSIVELAEGEAPETAEDEAVLVEGFARDPYAVGYVARQDLEPMPEADQEAIDAATLDALNLLLSAPEWPGASGLEDIAELVRATGRRPIPNAPEWERH